MADDPGFGRFTEESRRYARLVATMEPAQLRLARAAVRRLRLRRFVDAGANVGLYAIRVGLLPKRPEIEAFEPSPATAAALAANLALNPDVRARVHRVALSDRSGEAAFDPRGALGPGARLDPAGPARVALARLDDVLPVAGRRDAALKVDVEGHELALLDGGGGFVAGRVAWAQVESWSPKARAAVRARMEALGFRFVLRAKGDQMFLHESLAHRADEFREVHAKAADEAFALAGRMAREGARALADPGFRAEAAALYEGAQTLAPGGLARLRRALRI